MEEAVTPREVHVVNAQGAVVLKLLTTTAQDWREVQRWAQEAAARCKGTVRIEEVKG